MEKTNCITQSRPILRSNNPQTALVLGNFGDFFPEFFPNHKLGETVLHRLCENGRRSDRKLLFLASNLWNFPQKYSTTTNKYWPDVAQKGLKDLF
jgi:hypothetical protein